MENIGEVKSVVEGQFYVKNTQGELVELKVGDIVNQNDTIVAANSNNDLSKIEILLTNNELIFLSQGELILDSSLFENTFNNEELAFNIDSLENFFGNNDEENNVSDWATAGMDTDMLDVTEEETAAGEEETEDAEESGNVGQFATRDGFLVDVASDLRARIVRTSLFNEVEKSEELDILNSRNLGESFIGTPTNPVNPVFPDNGGGTTPTNPTNPTNPVEPETPIDYRVESSKISLNNPTVYEGEDITIVATVDNAPQTDLVITLNNGEIITINAGEFSGSTTFTNPNGEDVYKDSSTETYTIAETDGGNYKDLDI
ncbi:hypothetical protein H0A43_01880, partial [Arcobacter lanthieri]|uniref:immunoglobulin-like domain-containing protein n=1 Tax=Aliarcobacter lanthieri TaxID=1355374 RepID=UPI001920AA3C